VGLPDAEADALVSMLSLTEFAYGEADWGGAMTALGTFLTACTRGKTPPLAQALASGAPLPARLQERLDDLQSALTHAADRSLPDVAEVAVSAWTSLGILAGNAPWQRTASSFSSLARRSGGSIEARISHLATAVNQVRATAMFESQSRRLPAVQVMNLHQTKGREADAVVALFGDDDFHGREDEPFAEASRLLYVVMTRARREITAILGHNPHPLVAPLARLA
jgi:DNA helicase II / ATP-dependent DNA helicase PcrA